MKLFIAIVMGLMLITRANAASTNEAFGLRSMTNLVTEARTQVISATESGEVSDFRKLYRMVEKFNDQVVLTLSLDELSVDQRLGVSNTLKSLAIIIGHAKSKLNDLREDKTLKVEELETVDSRPGLGLLGAVNLTASKGKGLVIKQTQKEILVADQLGDKMYRLGKLLDEQITRFYQ